MIAKRILTGASVTVAALVMTGCGAGPGSTGPATADPVSGSVRAQSQSAAPTGGAAPAKHVSSCDVVTSSVVATALGSAPAGGKLLGNGNCDYRAASGSVTVSVDDTHGAIRHQAAKENYQSATPVPGTGDDAFLSPADHRCSVLVGDVQVLFTLFADDSRFASACGALMKDAAGKIGG